ncbi:MAG: UDP-glucose 4-epimerase GalE [Bacteroidales bacterium]|nr:UDP-glucose 4-epimerase GalE [Bacteroidales bacterium]
MNKVLITGGTGYVGSHTAVEFIEAGFEVVIIDNLSNSKIEVLDRIEKITGVKPEFHEFDLSDNQKTADFFQKNKNFDVIIHFAAYKAVGESVQKPLMYYRNNLNSLMNILQGMKDYQIENLIFSSSCTVYGQPEKLPVTEKSPIIKANSPYGNTKQIAEEIIFDTINSTKNLKSIALRYFNPIGAHKSALIGELPLGVPNNLIPYVTQTVAGIREQLSVFGDDYNTPDGTAIRDYIHVVDLAKAHLVASERLISNKNKTNFETFNIGTGNGNSVMEIINTFEEVTGKKINYKISPRREGDIEQVWADTTYANKELGWKTELSLADALLSSWNWQKKLMS